ncbi:glycosyltransferase [Massilia sp. CFBP 13647]|nr:glycosyltransferase [Massilia sp. CFBP 13647]MBD8674403.1 glycosyltransferase [Massilia sp. CFBP 13721]
MVAFHFPPQRGSSGVQRTLAFSRHLPALGWQPAVLTAHPRAHASRGQEQVGEIPPDLPVERAFALDSARHLSIRGRYLGALALPDRWVAWCLGAIPAGLRMVRRLRPAVIWSTYPIATAHLIGLALHRLTGLPWVADMRDPMIDAGYPSGRAVRAAFGWIEARTIRHAARVVCTTRGALAAYRDKYPDADPAKFVMIENGYDEDNFTGAQAAAPAGAARPLLLLHSGIIYPSERDPVPFFQALATLLAEGKVSAATLQVRLRAAVHDAYLGALIDQYGIGAIVSLAPHLPYREALSEMLAADALLVLQGANCNCQVPAKLYEYLRARRPILALTDAAGDTAATLRSAGIDTIGPLDEPQRIAAVLLDFLARVPAGSVVLPADDVVLGASRKARAVQLAALLDDVMATHDNG